MKKLYLITDHYPYTRGEMPFLLPELAVTHNSFEILLISRDLQETQEFVPPYGIPAVRFPAKAPSTMQKIRHLLHCLSNPLYKQEIQENTSGAPRKAVEAEVRNFLYNAEALRGWMESQGYFADSQHALYYSFWYSVGTMALALEKEKHPEMKIITRAHGYDLYNERQPCGQLFKRYMDTKIDLIGFISRTGRDYYVKHFATKPAEQYRVYRLGVSDHGLCPKKGREDPLELFSCSNVIPLKRIPHIIKAIARLPYPVHWMHAGAGEELEAMRQLCETEFAGKANITWEMPGAIPNEEVIHYYQTHHVDLFLNASETEGLPVSIMEAYSFGVPVLAPAVGGIPEMVHPGTGYLLSKEAAPEEIAEAITQWYAMNPTQKATLRLNARQIWHNSFYDKQNHERFARALRAL